MICAKPELEFLKVEKITTAYHLTTFEKSRQY